MELLAGAKATTVVRRISACGSVVLSFLFVGSYSPRGE
jgi:hypothetical protein